MATQENLKLKNDPRFRLLSIEAQEALLQGREQEKHRGRGSMRPVGQIIQELFPPADNAPSSPEE